MDTQFPRWAALPLEPVEPGGSDHAIYRLWLVGEIATVDVFDARAMTGLWEAALGDPAWTCGRGWALATGLNAYANYAATDPGVATQTTRQIEQALLG